MREADQGSMTGSPEVDALLARYFETRSVELRNEIAARYWEFAMLLAHRIAKGRGHPPDEYISAAASGLLRAIEEYDGRRSRLSTWIGKHVFWAAPRQRTRVIRTSPMGRGDTYYESQSHGPLQALEEVERLNAARDACRHVLQRLRRGERILLYWRFVEGRSLREIADRVGGISYQAVGTACEKAIRMASTPPSPPVAESYPQIGRAQNRHSRAKPQRKKKA